MNKRLFVGLSFSNLSKDFEPWMKKIRKTADHKEISLNWTPPENFHVTLVFLGDTDVEQIPEITEKIERAVQAHSAFKIKIRGIDGFPVLNQARVLYLGVQRNQAILDLQGELEHMLKEPDKREPNFVPHLTIARLRNPKSCRDLVSPFTHIDLGKQDVAEITLYSSELRGGVVYYDKIKSFGLAKALHADEPGLDSVPVF
jgi:2'-5' RNA ligase